ncbi:bacterio-opsin activator domain-containing protein [Halomarina oriensis]|uniref:bacterio-opsin activator domain-containing protein n=1 Tax=Halomarina oriensis TaxID=671145 RepID=UPI001303BD35
MAGVNETENDVKGLTIDRASVPEALDRVSAGTHVDCVLVDGDLDETTSAEAVDRLRTVDTEVPIVVRVGDDVTTGDVLAAGATDVVSNDAPPRLLHRRLENAVGTPDAVDRATKREALATLRQAALEGDNLPRLFEEATALIQASLGIDRCGLLQYRADDDVLSLVAESGWRGPETLSDDDSLARAALDATGTVSADTTVDDVAGGIALGLDLTDGPWGVLVAYTSHAREFGTAEQQLLARVADILEPVIERERRQEELERYETILETVDDAVYSLDPNFRMEWVNDATSEMTGFAREELIGEHSQKLADDDVFEMVEALSAQMLESGDDVASVDTNLATKEGGSIPIETRFSMLGRRDGSNGFVGVARDITDRKRYEQTLTALHSSTRELLTAEDRLDVSDLIVETASDVLDLQGVGVYLFDGDKGRLDPASWSPEMTELVGDLPTVGPANPALVWRSFVAGDLLSYGDIREAESVYDEETAFRSGLYVPLGEHGVLFAESTTADAFDDQTTELVDLLAASAEAALDRVERENELRERDEELREQNARLTDLKQTNDIIRSVDAALVGATTREEIETAVCERLVTADEFGFAWTAAVEDGELVSRATAGDERGYLDSVDLSLGEEFAEPAARAAATREQVVVSEVATGFQDEPWRRTALSNDYLSVLAVPLLHGDVLYGVLAVYATQQDAFDTMRREVLAEFGGTIANAINNVETRRTMLADRVTELELQIDDEMPLRSFAEAADCRLEIDDIVHESGKSTLVFCSAHGTDADAIRALEDEFVGIEHVGIIAEDDDAIRCEMRLQRDIVATHLADCGAVTRSVHVDETGARVVVELPQDADVREFVEAVQRRYPDTDLLARRNRSSSAQTRRDVRAGISERLTDRQHEVLRTAFASGFFEWPRDRTGQEVANSLDISQPTFNKHLRAAERKLFSMLLEG